jgi:adenylyltransferase/sulfurtransferase
MTDQPDRPGFVGLEDPYTRKLLGAADAVVRCCTCGAYQLAASWQALEGCASFGCKGLSYWTPADADFATGSAPMTPPTRAAGAPQEAAAVGDRSEEKVAPAAEESAPVLVIELAPPEVEDRYTRLRQLGWDMDYLRNAYALVVGAGALGNEVLKNLALLGWGHVIVVDMDAIEASNLARAVLFRLEDVGPESYKAAVAAQRVREINPELDVLPVVGTVQESLGLGVFRRMDVVFGCLDNLQARLDVSKACWRTLTPYIDGGLGGINGDVQTFVPPYTACYGCTVTAAERRFAGERDSCLEVKLSGPKPVIPTAPTISSVVAGWQAQVAAKHLHGRSVPAGKRIAIFGDCDLVEWNNITPSEHCPDHAPESILDDSAIVELPLCASTTTLAELARVVQDDLGMGPDTLIRFDFNVLLTGRCPTCGMTKEFYCRRSALFDKDMLCQECGSTLVQEIEYEFDGREPYARRTLASLGVPPLHILLARNWTKRQYQMVELSGDFAAFFAGANGHNPKLLQVQVELPNGERRTELLPGRVPVQHWLAWRGAAWELDPDPDPGPWQAFNVTQGCAYAADDTLLTKGAHADDVLRIARGKPSPVEEPPGLAITLEDLAHA